MKKIVINPDQSKDYFSVYEAIIDNGFEETEEEINGIKNIYTKNNKFYRFMAWDHFNTTIYSIELLEVDKLEDFECYYLQNTKDKLEKELLNNQFALCDLNVICQELTDESENIFDYEKNDFLEDSYGSFAYGSNYNQRGLFNVEFNVIEDNKDIRKIIVRVTKIEII